jgi:hypothetical protein
MKRAKNLEDGKDGLGLIEEAAHRFRAASPLTLATYYVGTIPFLLAFLYFLVDMSRSPFAGQHVVEASLGLAALFFWMKLCQASFAARMRAQLALKPAPQWGFNGSLKVLLPQIVIHSTGLFILPLAAILVLPLAWIYAFYQSTTVLADPESGEVGKLVKRAWKQAALWVFENHTALGIAFLFAVCVLLNWTLVAVMIPGLIKTLLGIETAFNRSPIAMVNTTFFGIILGLTYLCVDPILKTVYVLRCFYGESLQSGEDLKADLRQFGAAPRRIAGMLVLSIGLVFCGSLHAAQTTPVTGPRISGEVSPAQLDREIDEVIRQTKYTWRLPRKAVADAEKGIVTRFFERVLRMLRDGVNAVVEAIGRLLRWIFEGGSGLALPGFGWMTSSGLLFVLLAALACLLTIFILRSRRRKAALKPAVAATAIESAPDLTDETIRADQLPEDGWTRLARQLMENGEYRLAMRAYYLATLANLAQRNLVGIAHFKSNRDYENELRRRGHSIPALASLFGENLVLLERTWYGLHAADRELVLRFATNVDRIRAAA